MTNNVNSSLNMFKVRLDIVFRLIGNTLYLTNIFIKFINRDENADLTSSKLNSALLEVKDNQYGI